MADISCDIRGSIEFLEKSTTVEEPYFEYDPLTGKVSDGISGQGVAMMSVDILPTELPKESSRHFGDALLPLMEKLIEVKGKSKAKSLHDLGDELPFELVSRLVLSPSSYETAKFWPHWSINDFLLSRTKYASAFTVILLGVTSSPLKYNFWNNHKHTVQCMHFQQRTPNIRV